MNEVNKKILNLIFKEASLSEISHLTNLDPRKVWQRINALKRIGYNIKEKYYSNGDIVFSLSTQLPLTVKQNAPIDLYSFTSNQSFKALIISDLHFGNINERTDLLYRAYDYCAEEGIHIILNCGDFIDGFLGRKEKIYENGYEQLKHALKKHPFDNGIISFVVLGNHDASTLDRQGIDISKGIKNSRPDIIPLGYARGTINIKNDSISLCHSIKGTSLASKISYGSDSSIICFGHSHKTKIDFKTPSKLYIDVPSLSNLRFSEDEILPGAIEIECSFNKGFFETIIIKSLLFGKRIYKTNEMLLTLRNDEDIQQLYEMFHMVNLEEKKLSLRKSN